MIIPLGTALVGVLFCLACTAPSSTPVSDTACEPVSPERLREEGWRVAAGDEGNYTLAWRCATGEIPRNRDFEMELLVFSGGEPLCGAQVRVRGWMPDHGHGLVRRPNVSEVGQGRYRVEGMLLHMRGLWRIYFDVVHEGAADIVGFEQLI